MIIDWVLSWEQTQLDQDIIGTIASWNTDPASDKAAESVLRFPGAVLNRDGAVDTHTSVWGAGAAPERAGVRVPGRSASLARILGSPGDQDGPNQNGRVHVWDLTCWALISEAFLFPFLLVFSKCHCQSCDGRVSQQISGR